MRTLSQQYCRTRGVQHAAREDDGAQRRAGAAVEQDVDVHGRQPAVARHAGAVADDARMPLRRRQHVFHAVMPRSLTGRAAPERCQRGVAGDHRRIVFLAAESAAGFRLDDADTIAVEPEQDHERAVRSTDTASIRRR
jgi:hypothetical protein